MLTGPSPGFTCPSPISCRQQAESEVGLQSKRVELSSWEAELEARQRELEALREECRRMGGEVKGERAKVEELQRQLHAATSQQVILQQHKEQLQQRISQVTGQVEQLQQRISQVTGCHQLSVAAR